MSALVAVGVLMLPWRVSVSSIIVISLLAGFGAAMVIVAVVGWLRYIARSIRYA